MIKINSKLSSLIMGATAVLALPMTSSAEVVGLTAGDFRVDESGAATYKIPIQVPAGTAGVKPEVSLNYSSNNMSEGPFGVGWAISGLSAINRCAQSPIYDNGHIQGVQYNSQDKFCLNGQRLILKSGTYGAPNSTYRTEVDNFSTITARGGSSSNGPQYFEIKTKSGETHYYGNSAAVSSRFSNHSDAFVEPGGFSAGTKARTWAVKVIKDVKNNYILFNYDKDTAKGSFYIDTIEYTGNLNTGAAPYAKVKFNYVTHDKGFKGYAAGGHMYHDRRVTRIDTITDGDNFRSYFLDYEASDFIEERTLLTGVQECSNTARTSCLKATTFSWQRPALATSGTTTVCESEPGMEQFCWEQPTSSNYQPFPSSRTLATSTANRDTTQVIDINGDGYQDLVYVSGSYWYTKLGPYHSTAYSLTGIGDNKKQYALSIDYNGDGVRDLLVADSKTSNWYAVSYQPSQSTTTICPPGEPCEEITTTTYKTVKNLGVVATGLEGEAQVLDVNGDGMEDIVFHSGNAIKAHLNDGDGTFTANHTLYSFSSSISGVNLNDGYISQTANMKSASAIDVNGDGRSDLIMKVTSTTGGCYVNGRLMPFIQNARECELDIGGVWDASTSSNYELYVSSGNATSPSMTKLQSLGSTSSLSNLRAADFNGDGLSDLMYVVSNRWYYRLSDGTQLMSPRDAGLVTNSTNKHFSQFIDLNGDGRTDVLHATSSSKWYIYFSRPTNSGEWISFQNRGSMNFDNNAAIRFGDTTGDGKINLLTATSGTWKEYYNRLNIKEYVISKITTGYDVDTNITYKPMTDSNVYVFQASDANVNSDTFSPVGGSQLVSKVTTETGTSSSVSVSYQYGGLLIHKKGRGSLGFQMLRTIDDQTGVVSETQYNQQHDSTNFAKARMPIYTEQRLNNQLLSRSTNNLGVRSTAQGSKFAYISSAVDEAYIYGSDGSSTHVSTTNTSNTYDSWGNLTDSTVTITDEATGKFKRTVTDNSFGNSAEQQYGRLKSANVTKTSSDDPSNSPRKTTYSYNSDNMLASTVVSPESSATKVTTSYLYDGFGNTKQVTVTGYSTATGSTQSRVNKTVFDSRGRFINYTENSLGERTTYKYNGLSASSFSGTLNNATKTTANNISTVSYMDAFNQVYSINHPDSRTTSITRSFCSGCTYNSHYKVTTTVTGQPQQTVYYDRWARKVSEQTRGFGGETIMSSFTYDSQGRASKAYEPGSSSASTFIYDDVGRVSEVVKPNGGRVSNLVYGLETITSDENGNNSSTFSNGFGETAHTEDAFGNRIYFKYDAYGNVIETRTTAHGKNSTITVQYDTYGRKTRTIDPTKGTWNYKYNAFGELYSQTNAKNQTIYFTYDVLGRKVRSYESNEGTLCWNYGSTAHAGIRAAGKLMSTAKYSGSASCSTSSTAKIKKSFNYDSIGRPSTTVTSINGVNYTQSQTYDSYSRPLVSTYPNGTSSFAVKNVYNSYGYLKEVRNNATNALLKRIDRQTPRGQVEDETLGNGVTVNRSFQSSTGWLYTIDVRKSGVLKHNVNVQFDKVGNVKSRRSQYGTSYGTGSYFTENYNYDALNRLTGRTISITAGSAALPATFKTSHSYNLDHWGNFTFKTGAGYYKYDSSKVHKLLGIYSNSNFTGTLYSFSYDNNGNITSDGNRNFTYASFDKPTYISSSSGTSSMNYGVDRELYYKQDSYVENGKNVTYSTTYVGNYEKVVRSGGKGALTEHKYYIGDIVYTQRSNSTSDTFYLHKDHQGSVVATTNAAGNVISQAIYDPFGKRTAVYLESQLSSYTVTEPTDRGYTGHKEMASLDLIHMGGRVYDPNIGRFLQADPFVQSPKNLQNYNRYSYVLNNPMSYTDPSGYFFKSLKKFIKKYWKTIVQIGITVMTAGAGLAWAVAGGALSGYVMTGTLKGAIVGAISGAIFFGAGELIAVNKITNVFAKGLIRGMAGGVTSVLSGGKFGHGFAAAGVTSMAGGKITKMFSAVESRVLASAVVGGTVSSLTGGKFANGAVTAAFMHAYNEANHPEFNHPDAPLAKWLQSIHDGAAQIRGQIEAELTKLGNALSTAGDAVVSYVKNDVQGSTVLKGAFGKGAGVSAGFKLNGDTSLAIADETGVMFKGGVSVSAPLYQQGQIEGLFQQFEACLQLCANVQWDYQGNWSVNGAWVYGAAAGATLSTGYTTSGKKVADYLMGDK